jgi:hypothetical protein
MSRLEGRVRTLEKTSPHDVLPIVVLIDPSEEEEEKQLSDFVEKHGREPEHLIVVQFV